MRTLYNILFTVFFFLSAPYYFMRMRRRGNWRPGFGQRLGKFDNNFKQSITNRDTVWIHAVSVGEVNLATQLIRALDIRMPNVKFVVSTTTTTGMAQLEHLLPRQFGKIYFPIDRRKYVRNALLTVYPEAIVLVEAEIWPNFLWQAREMKIPVFLANARLSQKSYRNYKRFGFLFRPLFAGLAGVGAQNETDAALLCDLGCRPEVVRVVGGMKFDAAKLQTQRMLNVPAMLRQLGVPDGARLLVGGSTHAGEEAALADVFKELRRKFPDLFLVLVPRHFERSKDVARELEQRGVKFVFRSEVTVETKLQQGGVDCLLVNTTGELRAFYEHATVVFVGKSLTAAGGQNPIEPGALGKAIIFGPNMQNFADPVRELVTHDAAVQVKNAGELEGKLSELIADEARREQMGRNALKVVHENLGAVERTVDMIVQRLDSGKVFIRK